MSTVTTNKFKSTIIYGTLNVIDNPNGNIISNTTLSGNLTVGGKINNIPVATIAYISSLTSDVQAQINLKSPLESPTFTGTVGGITKTMVGLGNVENTTDLNKVISTSTQTALDLKGGLSINNTWVGTNTFNSNIPTTTLTPTSSSQFITKAYADSNYAGTGILSGTNTWTGTNVYNTNLPTSTLAPTLSSQFTNKAFVDLKASLASPTFTGTVTTTGLTSTGSTSLQGTCDITGTLSASSATISSIDLYGNYTGIKPINGNYLQFFTLDGFTFNTNTTTGFTGSNEALRIDNNAITLNKPTSINGNLNVTGALIINNIPVISSLVSSGINPTQNSPNTSGSSYTFVVYSYYSDAINVCCPIASAASGSFSSASLNVTNTINSITCQVNKNGSFFSNPMVTVNATLPLTKTTTITGNQGSGGGYSYNFKQYFINAIINFTPTVENATNTYTVTFTISGAGTFEYNTGVSSTYNV